MWMVVLYTWDIGPLYVDGGLIIDHYTWDIGPLYVDGGLIYLGYRTFICRWWSYIIYKHQISYTIHHNDEGGGGN